MQRTARKLLVHVSQLYGRHRPEIQATISQLLEIAGWQSEASELPDEADITYGPRTIAPCGISCASVDDWASLDRNTPALVSRLYRGMFEFDKSSDWVLASAFLLSGRHERQAGVTRNKTGVPSDGMERWRLTETPVVMTFAQALREKLHEVGSFPRARAPWPSGKRWAMCLTHDCDRVLKYNIGMRARDLLAINLSPGERLERLGKLAYSAVLGRFGEDPFLFSWKEWLSFEREMNIPGTYYIATRSAYDDGVHGDVGYFAADKEVRQIAQRSLDYGSEIGLHSSISCWNRPEGFSEEASRFEKFFGRAPVGFRGHYWSLNPENQEGSLRVAHETAQMIYDTSLGMNEIAGFRRGTAYPFHPFDRINSSFSGLIEVPPTIMDASLVAEGSVSRGTETFLRLADTTRKFGGVFVLDWHSDSLSSGYQLNLAPRLLPILQNLAADSSCWVTTPAQVARWCGQERWES